MGTIACCVLPSESTLLPRFVPFNLFDLRMGQMYVADRSLGGGLHSL